MPPPITATRRTRFAAVGWRNEHRLGAVLLTAGAARRVTNAEDLLATANALLNDQAALLSEMQQLKQRMSLLLLDIQDLLGGAISRELSVAKRVEAEYAKTHLAQPFKGTTMPPVKDGIEESDLADDLGDALSGIEKDLS